MVKLNDYYEVKDSVRRSAQYSIWNSVWNPIEEITDNLSWNTQGGKYD